MSVQSVNRCRVSDKNKIVSLTLFISSTLHKYIFFSARLYFLREPYTRQFLLFMVRVFPFCFIKGAAFLLIPNMGPGY